MPVFGLQTLEAMKDAGIKNAAIEAGSVLLLNKNEVIREAQRVGTSLLGIT